MLKQRVALWQVSAISIVGRGGNKKGVSITPIVTADHPWDTHQDFGHGQYGGGDGEDGEDDVFIMAMANMVLKMLKMLKMVKMEEMLKMKMGLMTKKRQVLSVGQHMV